MFRAFWKWLNDRVYLHTELEQARKDWQAVQEETESTHTSIGARMSHLVDEVADNVNGHRNGNG